MATLRELRGPRWRQPKGGVPGRGDLDEELDRRALAARKLRAERRASVATDDTLGVGVSSVFSPHLEKIPRFYVAPKQKNVPAGIAFRDKPGAVARLLIEAYRGTGKEVLLAARLARRTLEMLEYELRSPRSDIFIDAAGSGQIDKLRSMLDAGQEIDAQHTAAGYSALHAAAMYGHLGAVQMLVQRGADIHCQDRDTRGTPLHAAAENGQAPIVRFLVREAGIDKMRRNSYGLTAFDLAHENSHDLIEDTLREPPAQINTTTLRGLAEPRSCTIEWDIPDDHGVEIQEYEISWVPIGGVEAALFPDRAEVVNRDVIDATQFGPNPHAQERIAALEACFAKKAAKEAKLERKRQRQLRAQARARTKLIASSTSHLGIDSEDSDDEDEDESESESESEYEVEAESGPGLANMAESQSPQSLADAKLDAMRRKGPRKSKTEANNQDSTAYTRGRYALTGILMPSTEYAISVRAKSIAGWGTAGERLRVTTAPDVPDAPGMPRLAPTGATCVSVDLEWNAPPCNNGFVVDTYELEARRADDPASTFFTVSDSIIGSKKACVNGRSGNTWVLDEFRVTSYTAENLESDTAYVFRVRARNKVGDSAFGPQSAPLTTRPPARGVFASSTTLEIDWSESIDAKMIGRGIVRWELQRTVPPSARVATMTTTLEPSLLEDEDMDDPALTKNEPNLKLEGHHDAETQEGKGADDDEDDAYDWRSAPWETVTTQIVGDERSFVVRDLQPATMYFVRIRPTFRDEDTARLPWKECPVSIGLVTSMAVPNEPLAPIVSSPSEFDGELADVWHDAIRITWRVPRDNGNPISKFGLRCADVGLGAWRAAAPSQVIYDPQTSGADPGYASQIVRGLDPGRTYKFAVRAYNDKGWGPFSSPSLSIATRPSDPPGAPHLVSRADSVIRIEWESAAGLGRALKDGESDVVRYEVQSKIVEDPDNRTFNLCTDSLDPLAIWTTPASGRDIASTAASITDLQPVTAYYFRVRMSINGRWTNYSKPSSVIRTMRRF
ncbi:Ankyrin repeat domain-containing protein 2 [Hondaea fermentalgiana]|uniref:Ankyrin repeat domain-containing protein 2 n=1 Tax=Hondaea fermentalgiana TaxID=2315210 RepID=A0A2R5GNQ1_9STRA|nr:Ankyrin repeat domain-containing protein 2 [Hondaea fermentalgiana]|eukprot:GBG31929.1 Ankyrin repeat domain-containing protein 2 [Hondaea fermentalgiana]